MFLRVCLGQTCEFLRTTSMRIFTHHRKIGTRSTEEVCRVQKGAVMMQHPLEIGAHYYPAEAQQDHRSHRYRSFMIEEILTDHPDHKASPPAGDLLKFGVHALLSARPYPNHIGKCPCFHQGHIKMTLCTYCNPV